ncbi:hypothetical protein BKA70DRAFT_1242539 [Coprinopsis sp. MPI-PUGE-AT-0042]|nr:hypothetical protein BKA70DRAFT_1242539 [Coprinopsis sp. MPI-PUGE-AT-0042]
MASMMALPPFSPEGYNEKHIASSYNRAIGHFSPDGRAATFAAEDDANHSLAPAHSGGGKQFSDFVQCNLPTFYMSSDSETGSDTDSESAYQEQRWPNGGTQTVPNLMNTLPNAGSDTLYPSAAHAIPDSNLPLGNGPSIRVPAPNPPAANNATAQINEPLSKSHWFHAETQSSRGNGLSVRVTASRNLKISASWQTGDSSVNFVVQPCPGQVDVNAMQIFALVSQCTSRYVFNMFGSSAAYIHVPGNPDSSTSPTSGCRRGDEETAQWTAVRIDAVVEL